MLCCCIEVSPLAHFTTELKWSWRSRAEEAKEFRMPRKNRISFAPGNEFQICSLHNQYATYILSSEKGLQENEEHDAGEEQ